MTQQNRAGDWLAQAKDDLKCAQANLRDHFYAQCCFICQQAAEKAVKSIAFKRGAKAAHSHSLLKLCDALSINGGLREAAGVLDQYYISARYPDALPGGAPFEVFSRAQADDAVSRASAFVAMAEEELGK